MNDTFDITTATHIRPSDKSLWREPPNFGGEQRWARWYPNRGKGQWKIKGFDCDQILQLERIKDK